MTIVPYSLYNNRNSSFDPFTFSLVDLLQPRQIYNMNIDMKEMDNIYNIKVDLPGVDKKNIKLSIDNGYMTILAERRNEIKSKDSLYSERSYGNFSRTFKLPNDIDNKNIKASYKDGVLEVLLDKIPESTISSKYIEIE